MKEEKDILPDELFRQNLDGFEVPYNPAAWDHMRTMLDGEKADKPVGFVILPKNHKKKIIITMASITIVTGLLLLAGTFTSDYNRISGTPEKVSADKAASLPGQKNEGLAAMAERRQMKENGPDRQGNPTPESSPENKMARNTNTGQASDPTPMPAAGVKPAIVVPQNNLYAVGAAGGLKQVSGFAATQQPVTPESLAFGLRSSRPAWQKPALNNRLWQNFYNPVFPKGKSYAFQDGFIGIHFTWQEPITERLRDSNRQNAGFNLQFMSRNLSKVRPFGAYLGLDWGMQFYGHGPKTNVQLNTNAGDSGWTRLSTYSMDFLARGHFEYARFRVVPYVNAFAGPRLYSTNQRVSSYLPLKDNESTDHSNAATSFSFMYGAGAGLRVRISDVVSLDARMDWMTGTPVNMVDLDKSSFNGLNYSLSRYKVTPEYYQFRFGVLLNVGDDKSDDDHRQARDYTDPIPSYQPQPSTIYEYYDSTSGKWLEIPMCPCTCDSSGRQIDPSRIRKSYRRTSIGPNYERGASPIIIPSTPSTPVPSSGRRRGSGISPSLPSGGGRGSFPGISPGGGGGGIKIKS